MNNQDSTTNTDSTSTKDTLTNTDIISWLALGDSYTIGESVTADQRFPAQIISSLQNESLSFKTPYYIATTGWTTMDLLHAIAQQNPTGLYNVVTLLIGVNDQYQHFDTSAYRIHFTQCLQKAISFAISINNVFVLSIPDYSVTPFAYYGDTVNIRNEIDEYNVINKEITLSYNVSYTDITPLTREMKNNNTLTANDGLHPSGAEYAQWSALLAAEIKKVLK